MCAALQRQGYVDACATKDSDALILGATRVYHTINLQVRCLDLQQSRINGCLLICQRNERVYIALSSVCISR
jgi:hypothetical protein